MVSLFLSTNPATLYITAPAKCLIPNQSNLAVLCFLSTLISEFAFNKS